MGPVHPLSSPSHLAEWRSEMRALKKFSWFIVVLSIISTLIYSYIYYSSLRSISLFVTEDFHLLYLFSLLIMLSKNTILTLLGDLTPEKSNWFYKALDHCLQTTRHIFVIWLAAKYLYPSLHLLEYLDSTIVYDVYFGTMAAMAILEILVLGYGTMLNKKNIHSTS